MDEATGYCQGCARTIDEIASWGTMPRDAKWTIIDRLESRMNEIDNSQDTDGT